MRKKKNKLHENIEELYKKSVIRKCRIEEDIEENTRLDKYMGDRFSYYSRNKWQDLIGQGLVLLNNSKVKYTRAVKKGDEIAYHIIGMKEPEVDKNVSIVYDDGDLIIANKPANLPVKASAALETGTAAIFSALTDATAPVKSLLFTVPYPITTTSSKTSVSSCKTT